MERRRKTFEGRQTTSAQFSAAALLPWRKKRARSVRAEGGRRDKGSAVDGGHRPDGNWPAREEHRQLRPASLRGDFTDSSLAPRIPSAKLERQKGTCAQFFTFSQMVAIYISRSHWGVIYGRAFTTGEDWGYLFSLPSSISGLRKPPEWEVLLSVTQWNCTSRKKREGNRLI